MAVSSRKIGAAGSSRGRVLLTCCRVRLAHHWLRDSPGRHPEPGDRDRWRGRRHGQPAHRAEGGVGGDHGGANHGGHYRRAERHGGRCGDLERTASCSRQQRTTRRTHSPAPGRGGQGARRPPLPRWGRGLGHRRRRLTTGPRD